MTLSTVERNSPVAIVFANLKGNVGDFAILQAVMVDVARHFPDSPIRVYSHPLVTIDELRLAEFRRGVVDFVSMGSVPCAAATPYDRANIGIVKSWHWFQSFVTKAVAEGASAWAEAFRDYRAVFFVGGGQWHGKKTLLGPCMFGTLAAIHRHNSNILVYPFSVNPRIRDRYRPSDLRRYFGLLRQPVIVRDRDSKSLLESIGVPCETGHDCAFMLRDLVGQIGPKADRDPSRILFAVKGNPSELEAPLAEALGRGRKVELITSCAIEDEAACRQLSDRLKIPFHLPMSWQELAAELRASSLVVSNRLHCLIFGALTDTPLLPVTNRPKSGAFALDVDLPHAAANERQLSGEVVDRALADREIIMQRIGKYLDAVRVDRCSPLRHPGRQG